VFGIESESGDPAPGNAEGGGFLIFIGFLGRHRGKGNHVRAFDDAWTISVAKKRLGQREYGSRPRSDDQRGQYAGDTTTR